MGNGQDRAGIECGGDSGGDRAAEVADSESVFVILYQYLSICFFGVREGCRTGIRP